MIQSPPGDSGGDPDPDGPVAPPPTDGGPIVGPLRVDLRNPRYFTDGSGKIVYLTGSHTWANLIDRAHVDPPPPFDYAAYLDFLVAHHHNFMRLWTWSQPHSFDDDPNNLLYFAPLPWRRTGPGLASDGKPQFDLDQFDPAYKARLRDRVAAARDRGIYVAVMLFDGWDLTNAYNPTSGGFPFGAGNNINHVATTGPASLSLADPAITARQEAYVRMVIDAVNEFDNVLYEIANETDAPAVAWQNHMIDYVKTAENGKPRHHPVGMTSTYPADSDSALSRSNADWISPVGRLMSSNGTKVILNDTDHSYGWRDLMRDTPAGQRAWAWETLCVGASPLFMDPYLEPWTDRNNPVDGKPDRYWDAFRDALGWTRTYADRLDLSRAVPSESLCSTKFCLADPGHQYLVYQPPASSSGFTLNVLAGTYQLEWFNPATGRVAEASTIVLGSEQHTFKPPFTGDAVLLLQQ
jgi:hypothetical protein